MAIASGGWLVAPLPHITRDWVTRQEGPGGVTGRVARHCRSKPASEVPESWRRGRPRWPRSFPGFPSTSGPQLPSFLAPQPSPLRSQVSPHPASAPSPSPLPTHAKGQQKNVEQELDTFHSSFHSHGCLAWGRGDGRGIDQEARDGHGG